MPTFAVCGGLRSAIVLGQLVVASTLAGLPVNAAGAALNLGDILVTDLGQPAIFRVDPLTGSRSTLSGFSSIQGPPLVQPRGIAVDRYGQIFVSDAGTGAKTILRVDAVTGKRTIVSGSTVGSGDDLSAPLGLDVDSDGNLFVVDLLLKAVFRVDTADGQRTIISSSTVGSGPALVNPVSLTIDNSGSLLVADQNLDAIIRIDPNSGNRTVISGGGVGSGPAFLSPSATAPDPSGTLYVSDQSQVILAVQQASGNRQLVSGPSLGSGPIFEDVRGIARETSGDLLAVDASLDELVRVNVATGDRIALQSPNPQFEPVFLVPEGIALVDTLEIVGDYNGNGRIDAADYTTWRDMFGLDVSPGTGADGNHDGAVNLADYELWRMNFGAVVIGSVSVSATVPEPFGWLVLWQLGLGVVVSREGRWQKRHLRAQLRGGSSLRR